MTQEQKFARRWGYDQATKVFTVLLHESAPEGIYQLSPLNYRNKDREIWAGKSKGGQELKIKVELNDDGAASVKLSYGTKVVDTMWCRPSVSKCPSCGHEL